MDDLINDVIEDRYSARIFNFCNNYVRNETGEELNSNQIKAIDFILKNDQCLIIKGRVIGMSILLKAIQEFYISEGLNSQLIRYRDNTGLNRDLDVLIRDEMNGDDFKELDRIEYDKTKVIIASCAEGTDSYLYKHIYTSDHFSVLKLPSDQHVINSVRGVLSESELLREFCCQFIKY